MYFPLLCPDIGSKPGETVGAFGASAFFCVLGVYLYFRGTQILNKEQPRVVEAARRMLRDNKRLDAAVLARELGMSESVLRRHLVNLPNLSSGDNLERAEPARTARTPRAMIRLQHPVSNKPELPDLCVVTGDPAELHAPMDRFCWELPAGCAAIPLFLLGGFLLYLRYSERMALPFSVAGWAAYRRKSPLFSRIVASGLKITQAIPLLPFDLLWLLACAGYLGWWLPILDVLMGKRPLCKLHCGMGKSRPPFDMSVASPEFAREFLRLNPGAKIVEGSEVLAPENATDSIEDERWRR
jgi:hypothetical protein